MNIFFFTKSKPYTCDTLKVLANLGHELLLVCKSKESFQNSKMQSLCNELSIPVYENDLLYKQLKKGGLPKCDLAISNTYGRLIKKEMIDYAEGRIFNLHAAPLPKYRGMFMYNWAIFNGETTWAVTAHYVNEKFDEGEIIDVKTFPISPEKITIAELEEKSQKIAAELTLELVDRFEQEKMIPSIPQQGISHYYSREDFEKLKKISCEDSAEIICKKIRACWCPPYEGAYIERDGVRFPLQQGYQK